MKVKDLIGGEKTGFKVKLSLIAALLFVSLIIAWPAWGAESGKIGSPDPVVVDSPSFGALLLRVLLALAVVVGLALLLGKLLPRLASHQIGGKWIRVIGQCSLGQNKSLVLADILGKIYVLAVTDHQITKLIDENELDPALVRKITDEEKAGALIGHPSGDQFRQLLTVKLAELKRHFGDFGKMG